MRILTAIVTLLVMLGLVQVVWATDSLTPIRGASASVEDELWTGIERGPLALKNFPRRRIKDRGIADVGAIQYFGFEWENAGGDFSYTSAKGVQLAGKVRRLSIVGRKSNFQGADKPPLLEIGPGQLVMSIIATKFESQVAYGGKPSVRTHATQGTELDVINTTRIVISEDGKANEEGELAVKTWNPVEITGLVAKSEYTSTPVRLNLRTKIPFSDNPVVFLISLKTGEMRLTEGKFFYTPPAGLDLAKQTFKLATSAHRTTITGLRFESLAFSVRPDGLDAEMKGPSCSGEMTAKIVRAYAIPVLFNGSATLDALTATAPASGSSADLASVRTTNLRLVRATVPGVASRVSSPVNKVLNERPFRAVRVTASDALETAALPPPLAQFESSFTVTASQERAMLELGITSLTGRQKRAIADSHAALKAMPKADFVVHFPKADMAPVLARALGNRDITVFQTHFGKQEVLLVVDFAAATPGLSLPVGMKFVFAASPSITNKVVDGKESSELVVRYQVGIVKLEDTTLAGAVAIEDLERAVTDETGVADDASDDPATTLHIDLPLSVTKEIDLNRTHADASTNSTVTVRAAKVMATVTAVASVILLDETGAHVLGTAGVR